MNIVLERVKNTELREFARNVQEAFTPAVQENFGISEPVPSWEDIEYSFNKDGAEIYHIVLDGRRVGGAVLIINRETHCNSLELFFISCGRHGAGVGLAAWKAIEEKYPDTKIWETVTPYFEQRNIHFYVNKCGFHIVEFFNERHAAPNAANNVDAKKECVPWENVYFRFEKVMRKDIK